MPEKNWSTVQPGRKPNFARPDGRSENEQQIAASAGETRASRDGGATGRSPGPVGLRKRTPAAAAGAAAEDEPMVALT